MPAPCLVHPVSDPLPERGDDELMALAQAGMREAFAVLVERHATRLVQACARFVNDPAVGAELAQETWVAAWAARSQYRPDGKFFVWLLASARNRCRNHARHEGVGKAFVEHSGRQASSPLSPDQIDRLLAEERQRGVREALSRLPSRMREALLLRFAEDLRYDEMAAVLHTGESTLRSRVHHGLRLLKNLLEKNR
ncbi:MAG TPA: RNA polymerase sigma factor [Polyangiaceae bacterium]|jgi:RNA polymerase sigma-70 factor (ECF subfamily)